MRTLKTMKSCFILLFTFCSFYVAHTQTQLKVNTALISFKIKNAGLTVNGTFSGLLADIKFNSNDYLKSSIDASIDVSTINTGIDMRNEHLKKEDYFDVANFPKISLKSTAFIKEADGSYKGVFKLTIKGITKDISIPFSYSESTNSAVFKSNFTINRTDYKVGGNSWTMSNNVDITIVINTIK